jgi:hypothetical protein
VDDIGQVAGEEAEQAHADHLSRRWSETGRATP